MVFMVGMISAIILDQYAKVHEAYSRYQEKAEQDRRDAQKVIAESCFGMALPAFTKCVSDKLETYDRKQASDQDLQAQKDMAFWALCTFLASCAGLAVTVIGIYYVRKSLLASHEAVDTARQQLVADQRPWLLVVPSFVRPIRFDPKGAIIEVALDIRNIGKTPAQHVYVKAKVINTLGSTVAVHITSGELLGMRNEHELIGATQLPSEERVERRTFRIDREKMRAIVPVEGLPVLPIMLPVLIVCIDYRVPFTNQLAQTMRVYGILLKSTDGVGEALPIDSAPIPIDRLTFVNYPVAPGVTT
ncbi:hypothetical protein [Mesorhizobium atlanticum]|uniref:hypothetical protein n=1 Tax=Mesorhizobium atlanticum TaxID=2233532 RepID=UPI0011BD7327|nr:hypothetical protein [Mesorhizobium atlanticum]